MLEYQKEYRRQQHVILAELIDILTSADDIEILQEIKKVKKKLSLTIY